MRDTTSSLLTDDDGYDATTNWLAQHTGRARAGAWNRLRSLIGIADRWGGDSRQRRTSAELTTLLTSSRGQALRDAHRTLRRHLEARPVLRRMSPHLSALERALARRGSRALVKLPAMVLVRALQQLALLQREDQPGTDGDDLRVLQERLEEAITTREPKLRLDDRAGPETVPHQELLRGRGVEVRHISVDEFNAALRDSTSPRRSRH